MKKPLFSRRQTKASAKKFGRRTALCGLGGAVLAIPMLPSLAAKTEAQPTETKRFISYRITNGHFGHQWLPTDTQTSGMSSIGQDASAMNLSDIAGPISDLLDARFDPFRSKMNLFRHLDRLEGADHSAGTGLFGYSDTGDESDVDWSRVPDSIDQIIAREVFDGLYAPLNLSASWRSVSASFSVAGGRPVMAPGLQPHQAYAALFSDLEIDEGTADRRRGYQRTIVDRVLNHYTDVRANPRLSGADRETLDQHVEHMHSLHRRLSQAAVECADPGAVAEMPRNPETVNLRGDTQIDLALAALRCGIAPVVNLYIDPDVHFTDALHGIEGHHAVSHFDSGLSPLQSVEAIGNAHKWHMNRILRLIEGLEATPTEEGTLLDQSLVFVSNEIGNQNGSSNSIDSLDHNHNGADIQTLLIGSCGGAISTGKYIDLATEGHTRGRWTPKVGTAFTQVLISCMLAMGLNPEDWEVDGVAGYGESRGDSRAGVYLIPSDQVVQRYQRDYLPGLVPA